MRLGDLDALKKSMCELCNQDYSDEPCEPSDCVFYNAVEKAPTISAVPVVRCRECKSYDHGCCVVKRYRGDDSIITMPPGGYCSYGQRKEVDHD